MLYIYTWLTMFDSAEDPLSDNAFCKDKADGWYAQEDDIYTQCIEGRQVNRNNCGRSFQTTGMSGWPQQCKFCPSSCSCELECADNNVGGREYSLLYEHTSSNGRALAYMYVCMCLSVSVFISVCLCLLR